MKIFIFLLSILILNSCSEKGNKLILFVDKKNVQMDSEISLKLDLNEVGKVCKKRKDNTTYKYILELCIENKYNIPDDSRFILHPNIEGVITSIEIRKGKSNNFYSSNDTIFGQFLLPIHETIDSTFFRNFQKK